MLTGCFKHLFLLFFLSRSFPAHACLFPRTPNLPDWRFEFLPRAPQPSPTPDQDSSRAGGLQKSRRRCPSPERSVRLYRCAVLQPLQRAACLPPLSWLRQQEILGIVVLVEFSGDSRFLLQRRQSSQRRALRRLELLWRCPLPATMARQAQPLQANLFLILCRYVFNTNTSNVIESFKRLTSRKPAYLWG